MAHLTNFSFEFFYEIFTEDASLLVPLLCHGAKKSKMTKNSNQGGPALNLLSRWLSFDRSFSRFQLSNCVSAVDSVSTVLYWWCASAPYRGLHVTGHNRSVDLSRACKLQHSCLHASRIINHVGVKMKQPPLWRAGGKRSPRTPLLRQCLFLFFFAWRWKSMRAVDEKQRN